MPRDLFWEWWVVKMGAVSPTGKPIVFRIGNPLEGMLVQCERIPEPKLEEDLHKFVEQHLPEIFRLKLVTSEFRLTDERTSPRPDTLAFDEAKSCFVVIEYKKDERKDGPVQLTTYASAKNNETAKRKMLEFCNKANIKVVDVNWNDYYCIYVGFSVSESLISNTSALSTDIRMYEIHAYDGIVVLRRVGMNQHSKDDGLDKVTGTTGKPIDPPPGMVAIMNLGKITTQNHLPQALQFPDGTTKDKLRGWGTVLRMIARWLYKKGHIKNASQSRLLNTANVFHNSEELRPNLFVKLNFPARIVLVKTQELLKDVYPSPQDFKITLRPKHPSK